MKDPAVFITMLLFLRRYTRGYFLLNGVLTPVVTPPVTNGRNKGWVGLGVKEGHTSSTT